MEPVSLFQDELELLATRVSVAEGLPGEASSCALSWITPNQHDQAILPLELILVALRLKQYPKRLLQSKLVLAKLLGLVPPTYRCADIDMHSCPESGHSVAPISHI